MRSVSASEGPGTVRPEQGTRLGSRQQHLGRERIGLVADADLPVHVQHISLV